MMSQGGGKIINVASMLLFQGGITVPSYTASKSGIAGITRALANEWAKSNINVNAIAPGYMATDNTAALRADPVRSTSILERIPAGRWGTPDDLKGTVVFLASSASDYLNGAIIPVDGGWLALTFINPLVALGPMFYILYHHIFNSWAIYQFERSRA